MGKLFKRRYLLYHLDGRGRDFFHAMRNAFGEREIPLHRLDFSRNKQQIFRCSRQVKISLQGFAAKLGEEFLINPVEAFYSDAGNNTCIRHPDQNADRSAFVLQGFKENVSEKFFRWFPGAMGPNLGILNA